MAGCPVRRADNQQLQTTAAAVAATPQLASKHGRDALITALQSVVGIVARADDPDADLVNLISAVLDRDASTALFGALIDLAVSEEEKIAAETVRYLWHLHVAVAPVREMLKGVSWVHVRGALAGTVCDVPVEVSEVDEVLELLADLRTSRLDPPPLTEFLVRLQQRQPGLEIPDEWFFSQGLSKSALTALRTAVGDEAAMRRKLVIDLRGSVPGDWQATVRGYLGPGWCTKAVESAGTKPAPYLTR